jgi:hypothetical protein
MEPPIGYWREEAQRLGIARGEIEQMRPAFQA